MFDTRRGMLRAGACEGDRVHDERQPEPTPPPTTSTSLGVVGIGRMGAALLPHLVALGPVLAHDIDPAREPDVLAAGARWAPTLAELLARVDVLVTVLPGPPELGAVMAEALPGLPAGALWLDLTSADPRTTRVLAAVAAGHGVDVVCAPMGGSVADATAAALTLFASGRPAAVERARPVLDALTVRGTVRHAGDRSEDGQVVKLLANALWFAHASAATEAMLVGQAMGLEPEHLHALLRTSAGGSVFMDRHLDRLLDGDDMTTFGVDRVVEELDTVAGLGREGGVPMPVLDASADVQRAALARYGPALGELLGARWLEERAGRRLQRRAT
ncbi:hypothetical protein DEI92_15440 [Curtobacterium sp. MCBD17_034]|nr:hypothetical protein DEI92_15440 [Curtobacterium sp. MCBD17_034]PZM32947.1 hypothetical protein DEI90_15155 [Curtobacterium sp. MCBD17_031]